MSSSITESPNSIQHAAETIEKITALTEILVDDLNACDMRWTLFVAAAHSYRFDSQLKPIPTNPVSGQPYEIDDLRAVIATVPPFSILLKRLRTKQTIPVEIIELLHWLLVRVRDPYLKSIDRANVSVFSSIFICIWFQRSTFDAQLCCGSS